MSSPYGVEISLKEGHFSTINSFSLWLIKWETESCLEKCIGMLHQLNRSFDLEARGQEGKEVLRYLFAFADGHFEEKVDRCVLEIRRKAYEVLGTRLFNRFTARTDILNLLRHNQVSLLDAILHFVRPGERKFGSGTFLNLTLLNPSPAERARNEAALRFTLLLCDTVWAYDLEHFVARRPQVLELLDTAGELGRLQRNNSLSGMWPREPNQFWSRFTEPCLDKLKQLVAARGVPSIEEGVRIGDEAAQLLSIVRIGQKEQKKRNQITALESQNAQNERRIKELKR